MTVRAAIPSYLEAHEPPEAHGVARDEVRLMTSFARNDAIEHTQFNRLPDYLRAGDVLVVNTSATLNAALTGTRAGNGRVEVHLSQLAGDGIWVIELRRVTQSATTPLLDAVAGEVIAIPGGASIQLLSPYRAGHTRLWRAQPANIPDAIAYTNRFGFPIRYGYVPKPWPLEYYQTIFARHPGSAEMPSAGRAFTPRVLAALRAKGVSIVETLLHTGVSSAEAHEPPYAEYFRVSADAAIAINAARRNGGRVIAVGTTVVRALESVAAPDRSVSPGEGWTDLVITPARGIYAVDALLTGFHEPQASHLEMLEALAGGAHIFKTYSTALRSGYLWHEFGDLHLIFSRTALATSIDRQAECLKFLCNDGRFQHQLVGHDLS